MVLDVRCVIPVQDCRVPWGLSVTPEVFPYVTPVTELGRGYPPLLAYSASLRHLKDSFPCHWHSQSVSLEGCLQFTTLTVINRLFTLLVLLCSYN